MTGVPSMREINVVERLKGLRAERKKWTGLLIPDFYSKYYIEVLVAREKTFPLKNFEKFYEHLIKFQKISK